MGNIPLQGGSSAVDEIDKNLKKVFIPYTPNIQCILYTI